MNSPAIHELKMESSVYTLFAEFLSGLFDGGTHNVGENIAVEFPKLYEAGSPKPVLNNLRFGQSAVPQPLNGVSITMVLAAGQTKKFWDNVAPDFLNSNPYRRPAGYSQAMPQRMATTKI